MTFLKYTFLITCFAPINLVFKKKKSKQKAVKMTAEYHHQDLSCIYRLHHAYSEKLHFGQRSGADCSSGLASETMTMFKGVMYNAVCKLYTGTDAEDLP